MKNKTAGKKALGILLSLALLIGMMPWVAIPASAYPLFPTITFPKWRNCMKLHNNLTEFRDLIAITAREKHIPGSAVERDYYIVRALLL